MAYDYQIPMAQEIIKSGQSLPNKLCKEVASVWEAHESSSSFLGTMGNIHMPVVYIDKLTLEQRAITAKQSMLLRNKGI